ncbi:MAG: TIM-barrel domain-containing protein [Anaerolineales bacterium]|jgi:alpha-D-xyloside xylohydrolase
MTSHDIDDFAGESQSALYARWAQFGLLSSYARVHDETAREAWAFGVEAEAISSRYARLRYRFG